MSLRWGRFYKLGTNTLLKGTSDKLNYIKIKKKIRTSFHQKTILSE